MPGLEAMVGYGDPSAAVGAGDASFEAFVAGASGRLFTMALLLTGHQRAEAEDLLQDARPASGPLWLLGDLGKSPSIHVLIAEVADGATVTLKVSASSQSYFQFSDGFYAGMTFVSCPAGDGPGPNGPFTDFYVGFILSAGRSGTADVWVPGSRNPVQVVFACTAGGCRLAGRG